MSSRVKVAAVMGVKLEKSELQGAVPQSTSPTPAEGVDVEAQSQLDFQICPWCGAVAYAGLRDTRTIFQCHVCENIYRE